MDDKLRRIEDKLDKVAERISSIDATLAGQHISLVDHIRRTGLLEEHMVPIEKHVAQVGGVLKAIGVLAALGGIAEGIFVALEYFKR